MDKPGAPPTRRYLTWAECAGCLAVAYLFYLACLILPCLVWPLATPPEKLAMALLMPAGMAAWHGLQLIPYLPIWNRNPRSGASGADPATGEGPDVDADGDSV